MKQQIHIMLFLLLAIVMLITACQKQPTANFTTDKSTYTAGDIVHCKDASIDAHSWKWTTPDGQTYTTRDLDYATDSNDFGGMKTFTLEVASKNKKKTDKVSKSVTVKEGILVSDYFSNGSFNFKPKSKSCAYEIDTSGKDWQITAHFNDTNTPEGLDAYLFIYLPGTTPPTSAGTYTLQYSHTALNTGQASIYIGVFSGASGPSSYTSISGQLNISITSNGKIRAVFNNVNADTTNTNKMSGDITCH